MTLFSTTPTPQPLPPETTTPLETHLSDPILLSERVIKSSTESSSFKLEFSELVKHVDSISTMLRTVVRFTTTISSTTAIYDRPIRRITTEVSRTLHRTYTLVRKCRRRRSFLHRLLNLVTTADFRRILSLLAASTADLRWLISILHVDSQNDQNDLVLSLPPIASNDPILAWVWSFCTAVQMSKSLPVRIEAAYKIASLGKDSDRNKKLIVEEGGVPPLLKLLKDGGSIDGQIAATCALFEVANNGEIIDVIVENNGVNLIVHVLNDSPSFRVQGKVSELVAKLVEFDKSGFIKEEFGRENVIRPLVSLLSFEIFRVEFDSSFERRVKECKEMENVKPRVFSSSGSFSRGFLDGGSKGGGKKSRENEGDEVKNEVKVSCARALWMLVKDSVSNSRRVCETKGLICLAKLIEVEKGDSDLYKYCVMAVMEITLAAEANVEFRRLVFKTSSPAAKAVVEQLLKVVKDCDDSKLRIAAIRSIGCLSRTFPARETRVIGPLIEQLGNNDNEVATEALIALGKFADHDNFLCNEHSKTIIEFKVVIPLLRLLRASQKAQIHGLILLCYLAINVSNNEALEQARVLAALRGVEHTLIAQNPQLRELIAKAVYHLDIYHGEIHSFRQSSLRI